MNENIIEVKKLNKIYDKTIAVKDLSFVINKGKIIGLLGPNGCGKTTTIAMILGLVKPTSGEVIIKSKNRNMREAAKNLFSILRLIKKKGYSSIAVSRIPNQGLGLAINDRLKRASKK